MARVLRMHSQCSLPACHGKAGRCKDHLCPLQCHDTVKLRKTDIVADAHAQFSKSSVGYHDLITRTDTVRFFVYGAIRHGNVKRMKLVILANDLSSGSMITEVL